MELREAHLPGAGRKYTLTLQQGGRLVLILYTTGQRELFWIAPDEDDPAFSVKLTEEEAREVAFILGGVRYQPLSADKMTLLLQEVVMEWIPVEEGCPIIGKTLADLELRRKTGVSIIAIIREGKTLPSPDPYTERIQAGDVVVAVGTRTQIDRVLPLCRRHG
ncbi:MAG: cation:proton antiporter regulatory subunit [Bacteroidia bacterium]|jgi:TrkA domain protein|nr:cation:proton antiporter regulatory subunit [Bacteroidia bacterium]GIV24007.1 MAG: potassium transporter TrkA [Bacteroidia bacterium]